MKSDDQVKVVEIAEDTEMQGSPSEPTPMDMEIPVEATAVPFAVTLSLKGVRPCCPPLTPRMSGHVEKKLYFLEGFPAVSTNELQTEPSISRRRS